jgi:hypothetical protein
MMMQRIYSMVLRASEIDAVAIMVGVADGSVSEKKLATWLRENTGKPARKRKTTT